MTDPYKVLGISHDATDEEVKNAYRALARKYHPDNYTQDNPLAELATEKMKEVNEAYDEIQRRRSEEKRRQSSYGGTAYGETGYGANGANGGGYGSQDNIYNQIRILLNNGRFGDAERTLDAIPEENRPAEWHFLRAIVLQRRGWATDAMRELEIACEMDPQNLEYQRAKEMFNTQSNAFGRTYYGDGNARRSDCDGCDFCTSMLCAQCLCNFCN